MRVDDWLQDHEVLTENKSPETLPDWDQDNRTNTRLTPREMTWYDGPTCDLEEWR